MSNEYSSGHDAAVELPEDRRRPHPDRLAPDAPGYDRIIETHEAALDAGLDAYTDPTTGLFVMTARYLWDRGTCCDSGCRHCPYLRR